VSEERNNVKRADLTTDLFRTAEHEEITWDLIQLLDHDSQLKALMEKAIAQAKAANPDPFSNPVSDLSAYYRFIDRCYRALPWQIEQSGNFDGLYDRIDQGMGLLYFIADQPLKELDEYDYFHSSLMYHEPFRSWFIRFLSLSGQFLNTEASWNEEYYQMALKNFDFHLHDGTYEDPANWKTFNDFFARRLKDANQRPIADPDDESIVVSPTDSVPQGIWIIDESGRIITEYLTEKAGLSIKTGTLTDVKVLLGPSRFADAFKNGRMTHTLLDINDYHRYHFPVSGIVREVLLIPQDDAPGGVICWDENEKRYKEYFSETLGWQSIETRGVVIVETDTGGFVAVIPVGMCQVASVNFESSVVNQAAVRKGDPLGYFQFGGSDIIMLFSEDLSFELTCQSGEHLLMGKEYGRINNQNK